MKLPVNQVLPLAVLVLVSGCVGGGHGGEAALEPIARSGPAADYPVVIGAPFTIEAIGYTPADALNYDAVGHAVVASDGGAAVSIAHKTLPLPSYAEVTALDSGKTILVRVERRGPMRNDRLVELSPGAAAQLGAEGRESAAIRIRRVNPPEVERALLRSGQRAPERMDTPQSLLAVLKRKLDPQAGATPVVPPMPDAAAAVSPLPLAKPVPASLPSPERLATPAAEPSPKPSPKPLPKPALKPRVQSSPKLSATAEAGGALFVQIGTFAKQQNAASAALKLGGKVRPAGQLSRVVLGPFADRAAAQAALAKARAAGYSDARIQRAD